MTPQEFDDLFKDLEKPWDRSYCEKWYIENPKKATVAALQKICGVPLQTLTVWSVTEPKWTDQRKKFQKGLKETTQLKTIEKISEVTSSKLAEILIDHYNSFERTKTIIDFKFEIELKAIEKIKAQYDAGEIDEKEASKELANFTASNLNFNSLSLERAVEGQRKALGVSVWQDQNVAVKVLEDRGFRVISEDEYQKLVSDETEESSSDSAE